MALQHQTARLVDPACPPAVDDARRLGELDHRGPGDLGARRANFDGDWQEVPVLRRAGMGEGFEVDGPAIVELAEATCVVRPGWSGAVDAAGTLVLEHS